MRVLGPLYTSFAPTGAPALAELGHPDVASGRYSCAARSHGCGKPFRTEPAGRRLNLPYRTTTAPGYQSSSPGKLSAVPHPSIPSPPPRTLFPNRAPVGRSTPCIRTHYSTFPERGMELLGERPVCSVATSGCPTRSEDGFPAGARNIPPRPAQPNSKQKASYREVGGVRRAADGNRTRVSGLGSVRSTIELQPHPLQSSVYPAGS